MRSLCLRTPLFHHSLNIFKLLFPLKNPHIITELLLCFTARGMPCDFKHSLSRRQTNWRCSFPNYWTLHSSMNNISPLFIIICHHPFKSFLLVSIHKKDSICYFIAHQLCVFEASPCRKETHLPFSVFINTCANVVGHFKAIMLAENVISQTYLWDISWGLHWSGHSIKLSVSMYISAQCSADRSYRNIPLSIYFSSKSRFA